LKKFLAIAISVVFLLGFAASAFALHAEIPSETQAAVAMGNTQITLGGSIRVRGEYLDNDFYDDNLVTNDRSFWDQRVRLSLDAKVNDNVRGFVMLESTNGYSEYNDAESDTWIWGRSGNGASGVYTVGNGKGPDMAILEAWILYTNDLVNLKIGHMPLYLGNKIFFDHSKFGDDGLVLFKDIDNVHLVGVVAKFAEHARPWADDADAYVIAAAYTGQGFNLSGDVTWVDDNSFFDTDLYNIGVRGDVSVTDNVNLRGDAEIQLGTAGDGISGLCGTTDCNYGGYAFVLGANVKLEPVTVDAEFGYGSGDKDPDDKDINLFVTSLSPGIDYITYLHGTRTLNRAGGLGNNGITNLTYIKGSVSANPMEKLMLKGSLVWMQSTQDYSGLKSMGDDIGWEFDGKVTYQLNDGLVYFVEGGYFFVDENYGQDDAWGARHGIELTF